MASLAAPPSLTSFADERVAGLQATLGRMELVFGVLSEAIALTDSEARIRWCNPAFARLAMRPGLAMIGKPVEQVLVLRSGGAALGPGQHPVRRVLSDDKSAANRPVIDVYETERGSQARVLEVYAACLRSVSETSAMMVIRDNTERHLAEQWLEAESQRAELVRAVAAASNEAEDPELALARGLRMVCRFLGWPLGRAIPAGGGPCRWFEEKPGEFAGFIAEMDRRPPRLAGLAAEVAASGRPSWSTEPAAGALRTALAVPVKAMGETKAVLEFFTTAAKEPDAELEPLFEQIGVQLGHVFERQQSRLSLLRAKEDLEHRVGERTRELTGLNASLQSEIASRERFQIALREAMERYHSLMQSVRDVIFSVSMRGRVESLNSAFDTLTGLSPRVQMMRRVVALIHPGDRKVAYRAFRTILTGGQVAPFELRIRHASGTWIFFECSLTLQARNGQEPGVAGIARDVTESRRSKAELMVRDRAMAATSEGIVITNPREPANPITFVNSGFERLTGYTPADAVGKSLDQLLRGPDTAPATLNRLAQAIEDCQPLTLEMRVHRRDGQPFWMRLVITPVRDADERPANFVAILSDISPQKEAERMKNEFVSTVSHELRTPLTSLRGFAELMLEREYPPEKQRKFLQIIHRESTRLGNMINDFLDVQRMEAGRQDYRFAKVPIFQVMADSAALFRPTSTAHHFEVECDPDLPDVRADADRLRQVTTNLLSNAVKFSPKGGIVTLRASRAGNMAQVSVSDQGIGIPPEAIGKLFQKFYRVDNTATRKIGGTGLGLSIVKQIIDAHGGRIWVESVVGEGTRVLFTLPLFA
jgi:PAS domain S-box-containing protein